MQPNQFDSNYKPTWCPGCGNYGIFTALKQAFAELNIATKDLVLVFDIGCNGNSANFYSCYTVHALHGRPVPMAVGIKLANRKLKVIAVSGDGGAYGEGGNHFIHTCRTNIDITYLVHNNGDYGLTTGQTSPTSPKGYKSKSTPEGSLLEPLNPIHHAIAAGATFVASSYCAKPNHLKDVLLKAINHKGFSVVDIYQPCVTFNKIMTYEYFNERIVEMKRHNSKSKKTALVKAAEIGKNGKLPIGIFYQENKKTLDEQYPVINKDIHKPQPDAKLVQGLVQHFA